MFQLSPRLLISTAVAGLTVLAACSRPQPQAPLPPPEEPAAPPVEAAPAAPDPDAPIDAAGEAITADFLRDHITKFSSDEFEGRGPTTPGDQKARAYLIEQLKALGYQPGSGDAWEQPFELVSIKAAMPATWTFAHKGKSLGLKWWDQYIAGSGVQTARGAIKNAEVVFVGYGIQAPEFGWDDFKGQDLKGKVLLMLNNDPDWDPNLFRAATRGSTTDAGTYKYESAARQGAAGAIIVHTTPSAGYPLPGRAEFLDRRAGTRLPAAERAAHPGERLDDRGRRRRELVKLAGQGSADKLVESAKSKDFAAGAARRHHVNRPSSQHDQASRQDRQRLRHADRRQRMSELAKGEVRRSTPRTTITSASASPTPRGDKIYNGALDNATGVRPAARDRQGVQVRCRPRRSARS